MLILHDHTGKAVRLTGERRDHFRGRLQKAGMSDFIAETLKEPDIVVRSNWDPSSALSYRFYRGTPVGDKWLCVVVTHRGEDAFVLTAYPTDRLKEGTVVWKKT